MAHPEPYKDPFLWPSPCVHSGTWPESFRAFMKCLTSRLPQSSSSQRSPTGSSGSSAMCEAWGWLAGGAEVGFLDTFGSGLPDKTWDHSDTWETEQVKRLKDEERCMPEKGRERKKSSKPSVTPSPLLASSGTEVPALAAAAGAFSLPAASVPAGAFRISLEVSEDTPPTAQPAQVAADPAAPGLVAVTSFSGRKREAKHRWKTLLPYLQKPNCRKKHIQLKLNIAKQQSV